MAGARSVLTDSVVLEALSLSLSLSLSQDGGGAPVLTDDVSLQVFMEHLKKLAVSSST